MSDLRIWNRVRVGFKFILWRVNLNIKIINYMMIKSPHDRWNHSTSFGRRATVFEVNFWMLYVPLYWCISWFVTMKGVELVQISSNTCWEEIRTTDYASTSLVSNSSTAFANSLLSNAGICNKCRGGFCIIIGGRWRTKTMKVLTWSGKVSWVFNHF